MKIAFCTDATSQIDTWQFMRGLSLTGALKQPGAGIRFVSRDLSMHLHDMPAEKHMQQCLPCLFRPALIGRPDMQIAIDLFDFLRIKRS